MLVLLLTVCRIGVTGMPDELTLNCACFFIVMSESCCDAIVVDAPFLLYCGLRTGNELLLPWRC